MSIQWKDFGKCVRKGRRNREGVGAIGRIVNSYVCASCKTLHLEGFCLHECTQEHFLAWIVSFARTSYVVFNEYSCTPNFSEQWCIPTEQNTPLSI